MRVRAILLLAVLVWTALAAPVPTPESHFGHKIGVDRTVLDWVKVVSYFQKLAASSDRIRFREIGKSTEGRPFVAVWISSAANIKNLDRYQFTVGGLSLLLLEKQQVESLGQAIAIGSKNPGIADTAKLRRL